MNGLGPWYLSNTGVFLLVDEIPTPSDPGGHSISCTIRLALDRMGYLGYKKIWAFTPKKQSSAAADPEILHISDSEDCRVRKMLFHIITFASSCDVGEQNNVIVISNKPPEGEFCRVLHTLEIRGFNVLLVQPHDEAQVLRSADLIFQCTTALDGSSGPTDFDNIDRVSYPSWEIDPDPANLDDSSSSLHF
ncbi:unnamed protein product [Arabidopsis halleri]